MSQVPQSFKHHASSDPLFLGLGVVLLVNLIVAIVSLVQVRNFHHAWILVLSIGALILCERLRHYPLKVQDRVIRLEERLRLQALAPAEWHAQIYRLTEDQLIGLRFAADEEVVELAKQVLEHGLNRKQIKERIQNWRADNWRI